MNCRFIHPGVNDKGNYSLISKPEPFSPNGAPPIGPHPLMPANPWVCTHFCSVNLWLLHTALVSCSRRSEDFIWASTGYVIFKRWPWSCQRCILLIPHQSICRFSGVTVYKSWLCYLKLMSSDHLLPLLTFLTGRASRWWNFTSTSSRPSNRKCLGEGTPPCERGKWRPREVCLASPKSSGLFRLEQDARRTGFGVCSVLVFLRSLPFAYYLCPVEYHVYCRVKLASRFGYFILTWASESLWPWPFWALHKAKLFKLIP